MIPKRFRDKNICDLDTFKKIISESSSLNEVREKMMIANYDGRSLCAIKKRLSSEKISIDHMLGKHWQKDMIDYSMLKENNYVVSSATTRRLIVKRGHRCEKCGREEWEGSEIPLEVHHIDGDKWNNSEENLVLLCPNCHAQTPNYRSKNDSASKKEVPEEVLVNALIKNKNIRQALIEVGLTAKGANYTRAYELAVKYNIKHIIYK